MLKQTIKAETTSCWNSKRRVRKKFKHNIINMYCVRKREFPVVKALLGKIPKQRMSERAIQLWIQLKKPHSQMTFLYIWSPGWHWVIQGSILCISRGSKGTYASYPYQREEGEEDCTEPLCSPLILLTWVRMGGVLVLPHPCNISGSIVALLHWAIYAAPGIDRVQFILFQSSGETTHYWVSLLTK